MSTYSEAARLVTDPCRARLCPVSAAESVFSPPAPFGSYRSSPPAGDSTQPGKKIKRRKNQNGRTTNEEDWSLHIPFIYFFRVIGEVEKRAAYSAVGRLVHVSLYLPGVGHQVLHPTVFQRGRIRSRKDGLDTVSEQADGKRLMDEGTAESVTDYRKAVDSCHVEGNWCMGFKGSQLKFWIYSVACICIQALNCSIPE